MDCAIDQTTNIGVSISKHLVVSVNGFNYAVSVPFIHKIVVLSHISHLPCEEPYILGTTKADGGIYTVVDLRILFGEKPEVSQEPTVAVLLAYGASQICAVVDGVISVIDIDTGCAIYPLKGNCHITGIVQVDDRIVSLLSVEKLFLYEKKM